jgi:hypothetical protein
MNRVCTVNYGGFTKARQTVRLLRFTLRRLHVLILTSFMLLTASAAQATRVRRGPTSAKHKTSKAAKEQHPRAIDDERATQIQGALVKAGYLNEVTGHWDSSSQAAMQKMQGDNGWQTKLTPDSRALIKLGLGANAQASTATPAAAPGGSK